VASIARETGWPIEYIMGLNDYWRLLMCGWKPKVKISEEDVDKRNRAMAARLRAMMGQQNKGAPRGR